MATSIHYQLLQPSQHEEAIQFVFEHFMQYEPMSKCLGFKYKAEEITEGERAFVTPCLLSNLSWCAVDLQNNNKMVGLRLINVGKYEDLPDKPITYNGYITKHGFPHYLAVECSFMDEVNNTKEYLKQQNEDKFLNLLLMGVHNDYKKLGIASELAIRSVEHGIKESGCHLAIVTCSNFYTQKIFGDKLHFEVVGEKNYADYVFKGEHIFANVEPPHKVIFRYVKKF